MSAISTNSLSDSLGRWHDAQATVRIDVTATRSPLQSLHFALQRIKDGLVDHHREDSGQRPSIDT
jgi:putative N6-adenine-specific DNA methylase